MKVDYTSFIHQTGGGGTRPFLGLGYSCIAISAWNFAAGGMNRAYLRRASPFCSSMMSIHCEESKKEMTYAVR